MTAGPAILNVLASGPDAWGTTVAAGALHGCRQSLRSIDMSGFGLVCHLRYATTSKEKLFLFLRFALECNDNSGRLAVLGRPR